MKLIFLEILFLKHVQTRQAYTTTHQAEKLMCISILLNGISHFHLLDIYFFFVWFDSLRPINNLSVIKGRVFLGWTSTKLGLMFLLKDTTQWRRWGSNPRPLGLESSTLPMSHCAPILDIYVEWNFLLSSIGPFHFRFKSCWMLFF